MKLKEIWVRVLAVALLVVGTSLGASESDETMKSSFERTYACRVYLQNENVKVEVRDGLVTLTGTVSEEFHKAMAEEIAASLPGVVGVENCLIIKNNLAAVNSDAGIRMRVRSILALHRLASRRAEVDVTNGLVILRGTATSQNQSDLTAQYAQTVRGVRSVRNEMTVNVTAGNCNESGHEKIDDASITAQVKLALRYHDPICARNNEVNTRDGVVLLTGQARDGVDQDRAAALLADIHGVQNVVDTHNGIVAYGVFDEPALELPPIPDQKAGNDTLSPALPGMVLVGPDR